MILCEPFTVFQKRKKKNRALITEKKGKIETEYSQMEEEQWWSFNAIDFFFFFGGSNLEQWWRSSKRRDKGLNTKRRERALTILFS